MTPRNIASSTLATKFDGIWNSTPAYNQILLIFEPAR